MSFVLALHNLLRWLILFFALVTIINSISGMGGKKPFTGSHKRVAMFLMISCDIQLLLGLILFYLNRYWDKMMDGTIKVNKEAHFFFFEHSLGMIIAIVLIHLGYAATKKNIADGLKFKRLFWFTLLALLIILVTIPWPGRVPGDHPWFRGM